MAEMCSENDRVESKMTPKLRAEWTGDKVTELGSDIVGFSSLPSCLGRPMIRNSVLEELSERKLDDIQLWTDEIVFSRWEILWEKLLAEKDI